MAVFEDRHCGWCGRLLLVSLVPDKPPKELHEYREHGGRVYCPKCFTGLEKMAEYVVSGRWNSQ